MDIERARYNMIESQIRTWEVLDQRVLDTLSAVKREAFVPEQYRPLAFGDMEIPLGHGEVMLSPKLEAYMTALLAHLAGHVYSVELHPDFSAAAAGKLAARGVRNVTLEVGDAAQGWSRHAPYDAILLTGSVPVLPPRFRAQLRAGGRLLAVVGDPPVMTARLTTCVTEGAWNETGLFETCIAPLRNVPQPERFVF